MVEAGPLGEMVAPSLSEVETPRNASAVTALLMMGMVAAFFILDGNLFYSVTKGKVMFKMVGTLGKKHDCICGLFIYKQ